jgi:hypothetical protein
MNDDQEARSGGWGGRLGLLVFGLIVVALLGEIGLRVIGYRPPEVLTTDIRNTYRIEPNGEFVYRGYLEGMFSDFSTPVKLNSLGFHDVEHRPERAATNTFRVMVVGDSYVAALSCPLETTFHRRLEARLNQEDPLGRGSYEVIAFGQGNQGQEKEIRYVTEYGPIYRPDRVLLLFFCGNDIMENSTDTFEAAARFARRYKTEVAPQKLAFFDRVFFFRRSRLNGLVAEAATTYYAGHLYRFVEGLTEADLVSPELGVYRFPPSPEWQRAYERTGLLLTHLVAECSALGAPLLVAGLSGPQAIGDLGQEHLNKGGEGLDPLQPARWLADWCEAHDVPYVALEPALAAAGRRNVFWRHDGHLNPRGNEAIVDPIYRLVTGHASAADGRLPESERHPIR